MIVLTGDPAERYWQLGAFPAGDGLGVMAGWTLESPGGGVPAKVARVLAGAMARYGRITFPCSVGSLGSGDSWQMQGEDAVSRPAIAARGAWRRLLSRVAPAKIPLLSTRREDAALHLFEDPYFQWWNASQFALVSRPPEVPPPLVSPLPFELFEEIWPNAFALLRAAGVEIIMRSVDWRSAQTRHGASSKECSTQWRQTAGSPSAPFQTQPSARSCWRPLRYDRGRAGRGTLRARPVARSATATPAPAG